MVQFLKRSNAPDLAFIYSPAHKESVNLPLVVFLGGFRSDMEGTKATFLEKQCKDRGQAFLRFDYRGHGKSEGEFEKACISDWLQDASDIIDHCANGQSFILIGSSMGGWISLLIAECRPKNVQAVIGLAAAPNFTQWMQQGMSEDQIQEIEEKGFFELPNDYDDEPYIITKILLEDGANCLMIGRDIDIECPVRLIQGKQDVDVPWDVANQIKRDITSDDVEVIFIEEADHRLSTSDQLNIIDRTLKELC